MIKALIFDFDGVILESSEIKTIAFDQMFKNETEEIQNTMREYHLTNMGFSRQKKFEYYFKNIKKENAPDGAIEEMSIFFHNLYIAKF